MEINFLKKVKIDIVLISILIVAIFLRLYNIGFQDAWLDEIHTLKESDPNLTFKEFYDVILFREGISHFYFLIIRFIFWTFGQSIVIARLVSAIFGILSVFYLYKTANKLFDKNTGYLAAFLLALNLLHIGYSQEARAYSVFTFFVILSAYRLLVFLEKVNYKNAIWLGIVTGLVANAHSIGLLNIVVVYITIFVQILLVKPRIEKIKLLKFSFISGLVTLLVFSPVYLTIKKASQLDSFWVAAPTFDNIKQIFVDLSGKSLVFFYSFLILIFSFFILSIYHIIKKSEKTSKIKFNFIYLLIWFLFCSVVLIVKSYTGTSLILNRYFISILPAIILMVALAISYINNSIFKTCFVLLFSIYSLYFIFIEEDYYNKITKTQFSSIANEIISKKTNAPVFSSWGWLMTYYINSSNSTQIVTEMTFDDYLTAVKNDAVKKEPFWYMDGNSRPFDVSAENNAFLKQNFKVVNDIKYYDTWAKYYIPIIKLSQESKTSEVIIDNNDFDAQNFDSNGNIMFFENGKIKSTPFIIDEGNYILKLSANSLPDVKINNENAHIIIKLNNKEIGNLYLNENINNKEINIPFNVEKQQQVVFSITFDNDLSTNKLDRNVIIYAVRIVKK